MSSRYTHISELMACAMESERGWLPIQGFHALAGVEITEFLFSKGNNQEPENLARWSRRMAWFWNAMAFSSIQTVPAWFAGYELRASGFRGEKRNQEGANAIRAGLWVKTVAPHVEQAVQAAETLADMALALLPADFHPKAIPNRDHFLELWGTAPPAWLGEIRPGLTATPKPDGDRAEAAGWELQFSPWNTSSDMLEPWALLAQMEGTAWLSLGICPTHLFEAEKTAWEELSSRTQASAVQTSPLFQVRVRVGGDEKPAQWLAQALASALHNRENTPVIQVPCTAEELQNATFNWQWGDFQPWAEVPLPVSLRRQRYLMNAIQIGGLAGVWG